MVNCPVCGENQSDSHMIYHGEGWKESKSGKVGGITCFKCHKTYMWNDEGKIIVEINLKDEGVI